MKLKLLTLTLALTALSPAVVLDRIAASVGKQLILESEVTRALRVAAFLDQKQPDLSGEAKRRAAERLVDQLLMVREASENRVTLPSDEEGSKLLADARTQFADPVQYQAALRQYQLTESEVRSHLLAGYRMLRFTDLRFRPEVQVTDEELADFYQILAAGWRRSQNGTVPTFEESRAEVQRLLMEQKSIQKLDTWLASARIQVGVSYRERVFE
jgi:hypothetical protein